MQNLRGQTKSIMVFSEVAYCPIVSLHIVFFNAALCKLTLDPRIFIVLY